MQPKQNRPPPQPLSPVRLLLLVLQLLVGLGELLREDLQLLGELVLLLEVLGQQHQVPRGVVQRDVAEEEAAPTQVVQTGHAGRAQEEDGVRLGHVDHLPLQAHDGGVAVLGVVVLVRADGVGDVAVVVVGDEDAGTRGQHVDGVDVGEDVRELQLHVGADHLQEDSTGPVSEPFQSGICSLLTLTCVRYHGLCLEWIVFSSHANPKELDGFMLTNPYFIHTLTPRN